ncbi:Rpn family recombination-promoting nuclease/putative transposase [Cardinium endosymbiont of Culicoides punctatus]|uniref:Rpn family recombination-promoting nuclease/putative transposase n=1 Tax=Cardinium endosymbiont of Culicoides punctatus TaxID=2304601 RepID=UPI0010590078|nr:Rpn family recombination-promoting nuclease/putative transposase [Cardinium endosymbiont of Culicoides punctatus]TDG93074.1 hypothetical protein CCPUN_09560 [Cardinium endosymbiont of Culicoides punctatus]
MEKLTPRVDIVFKKLFGVEENKDLLISLINAIVRQEDQVADITLLNPYNHRNFRQDKLSILDIKAESCTGKRFNIEIQITDAKDYDKRALYYWAKLYTEQLEISRSYDILSKAIGIHILNFISIPTSEKYHNIFHIKEVDNGMHYFKDLELHTIELKKFISDKDSKLSDIVSKVSSGLDRWVTFLSRHDLLNKEHLPSALNDSNIKKALDVLDVMNFNSEEKEVYEDHLKWIRTEALAVKTAEEKGEKIGIEKGRIEGKEEGIKSERYATALKMLQCNMDIETISTITTLSKEEIISIIQEGAFEEIV